MQHALEVEKNRMQILLVDDQQPVLNLLQELLEMHGYKVLTATDGVMAMDIYRESRPSFTLTDISMPNMNGLELLRQIKSINAEAVVMLMTGAGSESFAVEALRGGAVNYFNKPLDINDLITTLNRYKNLALGYDYEGYAGDLLQSEHLSLQVPNDLDLVNSAVQMIVNHCRAIFHLDEIFTLRFGLYEMMVNAVEHGNLGITFEEKSKALEDNRLTQLMDERARIPEINQRRIHVDCQISPRELYCKIRDEGDGFDHSTYTSVDDPASMFESMGASLHGRGIMLTRLQFDDVRFNAKGNEVRILKHVKPGVRYE